MESIGQSQSTGKSLKSFVELLRQIMELAIQAMPRVEFLRGLSDLLLQFSGCDYLVLRARGQVEYILRATPPNRGSSGSESQLTFEPLSVTDFRVQSKSLETFAEVSLRQVVEDELNGNVDLSAPCFTPYGSFWTSDVQDTTRQYCPAKMRHLCSSPDMGSVALIPFAIDENNAGLLRLEYAQPGAFARDTIAWYEVVVETVGLAIAERRARSALQERVKELSCLYSIARVVEDAGDDVPKALAQITALLPQAWQYPEIAAARITVDGEEHETEDFNATVSRQTSDIVVDGVQRGAVEIGYMEEVPHVVGTPFLKEEEHLITAIARAVGEYVERQQAASERSRLELQLRHADRLATIGQLAAGVAHEINEPLGGILGFAQLALKGSDVTESSARDLNKIVTCSLQARDIVTNLKLFARQTPIQETRISINEVVQQALSLIEGRCANQSVDVVREWAEGTHLINGDPVQLKQVIVNLLVNAMHSMPDGGTLSVAVDCGETATAIVVQDTGAGMTDDTMGKIFDPFFTTKDVGEGTGLGLSVVHGIITAHGGTIDVASEVGMGTTFTITLPGAGAPTATTTPEMRQ
jgi:signal transduction histidine kinase